MAHRGRIPVHPGPTRPLRAPCQRPAPHLESNACVPRAGDGRAGTRTSGPGHRLPAGHGHHRPRLRAVCAAPAGCDSPRGVRALWRRAGSLFRRDRPAARRLPPDSSKPGRGARCWPRTTDSAGPKAGRRRSAAWPRRPPAAGIETKGWSYSGGRASLQGHRTPTGEACARCARHCWSCWDFHPGKHVAGPVLPGAPEPTLPERDYRAGWRPPPGPADSAGATPTEEDEDLEKLQALGYIGFRRLARGRSTRRDPNRPGLPPRSTTRA